MLDTVKVRRLIKEAFGTRFAFGSKIGMDPTQLSRYLNGGRITLGNACRIADGLSVPLDDILSRTDTGVAGAQ